MRRFAKSRLAARLQMVVSRRRLESGLYTEIAYLLPLKRKMRILDVGTGTGLQLKAIHDISPTVSLYGLDISSEAINLAKEQLAEMKVDLRVGNIERTEYESNYFDIVTCNASMSYWKRPVVCFNEIYRILKPGGCAILIEPHAEIDIEKAIETIKKNLADKSPLRRLLATTLNRFGLKRGGSVGMNLYKIDELKMLTNKSRFKGHGLVEKISLQNLPIFARILLTKPKNNS